MRAVAVAGLSLGSAGAPAAAQAADVDSAVSNLVDLVKATGEVVKSGVSAAQTGAEYAKQAYDQVAPVVKSAVETAAPVVQEGVKAAVQTATPALQTGLKEAERVLQASGVDPSAAKPLVQTTEQVGGCGGRGRLGSWGGWAAWAEVGCVGSGGARTQPVLGRPMQTAHLSVRACAQAVTTAKPFVEQAVTFLTTTEPALLGQYALVVVSRAKLSWAPLTSRLWCWSCAGAPSAGAVP